MPALRKANNRRALIVGQSPVPRETQKTHGKRHTPARAVWHQGFRPRTGPDGREFIFFLHYRTAVRIALRARWNMGADLVVLPYGDEFWMVRARD